MPNNKKNTSRRFGNGRTLIEDRAGLGKGREEELRGLRTVSFGRIAASRTEGTIRRAPEQRG